MRTLIGVLSLVLCACAFSEEPDDTTSDPPSVDDTVVLDRVESEEATFRVVRTVKNLEHPWGVDWLPDGRTLITERPGKLRVVDEGTVTTLSGLLDIWVGGQGGLLDVAVPPDYEETGWIYFTYSTSGKGAKGTALARAKLNGASLTSVEELYRQFPFVDASIHFGARISFSDDGTVIVTLGERGQRQADSDIGAQDSTNTIGTTIRLNRDGSVPTDNPFVGRDDVPDEVYSYGHRNQQGMDIRPETGAIWQHEHGPHGGDELNLVQPAENYGWPAVTYGDEYTPPHLEIGGTEAPGMTQPVEYWDPSPAFSGMTFYTGNKLPNWKHHLFMGALAHQKVLRVTLDGKTVTHQEELLEGELGRIRDVATGPDGSLYLLTDASNGGLYRLEPVE